MLLINNCSPNIPKNNWLFNWFRFIKEIKYIVSRSSEGSPLPVIFPLKGKFLRKQFVINSNPHLLDMKKYSNRQQDFLKEYSFMSSKGVLLLVLPSVKAWWHDSSLSLDFLGKTYWKWVWREEKKLTDVRYEHSQCYTDTVVYCAPVDVRQPTDWPNQP